ncbi:hypothetical protein CYMTET_52985 [Cymbomonas tetramitiformis]|uniref:Uncharacterized protein n=1 Tax=Cymbomonas tetramitiformis TaxID=36881 RepID=A0AAE0ES72_9CHLO|nr:hypothetical protein CYMTET_52985 [Cymbomonas tetramitiformis]
MDTISAPYPTFLAHYVLSGCPCISTIQADNVWIALRTAHRVIQVLRDQKPFAVVRSYSSDELVGVSIFHRPPATNQEGDGVLRLIVSTRSGRIWSCPLRPTRSEDATPASADVRYWRVAVNGDGRRVEVGCGMRLSLWCHSGGHCILRARCIRLPLVQGEAEGGEVHVLRFPLIFVGST